MTSHLVVLSLARQRDVNNGRSHATLEKTIISVIKRKFYNYRIRRHQLITKIVLFKIHFII